MPITCVERRSVTPSRELQRRSRRADSWWRDTRLRKAADQPMTADPELIRSLEGIVASTPGNQALRLHLAELLVGAGRLGDALAHCAEVLRLIPDHAGAVGLAERIAAQAAGAAAPVVSAE